jgi:hypothetical protein
MPPPPDPEARERGNMPAKVRKPDDLLKLHAASVARRNSRLERASARANGIQAARVAEIAAYNLEREARLRAKEDNEAVEGQREVARRWLALMLLQRSVAQFGNGLEVGRKAKEHKFIEYLAAVKLQRKARCMQWYFKFRRRKMLSAVVTIQAAWRSFCTRKVCTGI